MLEKSAPLRARAQRYRWLVSQLNLQTDAKIALEILTMAAELEAKAARSDLTGDAGSGELRSNLAPTDGR